MEELYKKELIAIRRQLHKRPEEGWTEFETTYFITKFLRELGLPVTVGIANVNEKEVLGRDETLVKDAIERALKAGVPQSFIDECGGYTGAVTVIDTDRPGPTTAFRCDIDCVLVRETDDPEHLPNKLGFRSERPGFMHACGHDAHTAVGLTLAHWINDHKDKFCGKIKIIFQPAEEGVRGARAMTAAGIVDDVDYFVGGHIGGVLKLGEIAIMDGGFLASSKFDVSIKGRAAHAGNCPELGNNALMAACAASMMIQGISRHGEGATRICVGTLHAGEGRNVIPATAKLQMEVRGETHEINEFLKNSVQNIFEGIDKAYGVQSTITLAGESTSLTPCPEFFETLEGAMQKVPGTKVMDRVHCPSGSEDCALFLKRVIDNGGKAAFVLYGCNHGGHHRSNFDIQDEKSLPIGFDIYRETALIVNGAAAL